MNRCHRGLLILLAAASMAAAEALPSPSGYPAVVCVPSHGGSATFIATFPPSANSPRGVSYLLSCAHLLDDGGGERALVLHAPAPNGSHAPIRCRPRFVAFDHAVDLSLIRMDHGPVPHIAPVAPRGHAIGSRAVACGYDQMRWPGQRAPVTIFRVTPTEIWTREKPIPGRSGGGLLDPESGQLIGVCLARIDVQSDPAAGRGIYCSLEAIHRFLEARGYGWLVTGSPPPAALRPKPG